MSQPRDSLTSQHAGPHIQQSSGSSQQAENYQGSGVNYTFKVFTTKRTLVLCAPSEEEEIKWISAIRALIARRTKEKEAEAAASNVKETGVSSNVATGNLASTTPKTEKKKGLIREGSTTSSTLAGGASGNAAAAATATATATATA
jgi:hypothetical protein